VKSIVLVIVLSVLFGCTPPPRYSQKAMYLEMGMNKRQVFDVLGEPKKSSVRKDGDKIVERYSWWATKTIGFTQFDNEMLSDDKVSVTLEDGKVVKWGDSFDYTEMMDKSMEMMNKSYEAQNAYLKNAQESGAKVTVEQK